MSKVGKNILISLEGRHVDSIISGEKKVELRSRYMNLSKGDNVWIYSKKPHGRVVMKATVKTIVKDSPRSLWKYFREVCGLNEEEFFTYFSGVEIGYAISMFDIKPLPSPPTLETIRSKDKKFHPPQFSKYLDGAPLLSFFEDCLTRASPSSVKK